MPFLLFILFVTIQNLSFINAYATQPITIAQELDMLNVDLEKVAPDIENFLHQKMHGAVSQDSANIMAEKFKHFLKYSFFSENFDLQQALKQGLLSTIDYQYIELIRGILKKASTVTSTQSDVFFPEDEHTKNILTDEDIIHILSIIDDTQSYIKGMIHIFLQGMKPKNKNILYRFVPKTLINRQCGIIIAMHFKLLSDNLTFLRNTVAESLTQPHLKDAAFKQLIKEIRAINHWFATMEFAQITSLKTHETIKAIFADLQQYFPACNFPNLSEKTFNQLNGPTRVKQMDEITTGQFIPILEKTTKNIEDFKTQHLSHPWQFAALKELKDRGTPCQKLCELYENFCSEYLEILENVDPQIEELCRPFGMPKKKPTTSQKHYDDNFISPEHQKYLESQKQHAAKENKSKHSSVIPSNNKTHHALPTQSTPHDNTTTKTHHAPFHQTEQTINTTESEMTLVTQEAETKPTHYLPINNDVNDDNNNHTTAASSDDDIQQQSSK